MYATDFEYDGLTLSDFGMMIGSFSSPGTETVSSGADINFHTVSPAGSDRFRFYGTKYEEAFTATLQICKSPCLSDTPYLTPAEISGLQRWLCRKDGYHRLHFISDSHLDIYWNAAFSSKQVQVANQTAGLELTLFTDAPYAYRREETFSWTLRPRESFSFYDSSDEVGYIYPLTVITSHGSGNIELSNSLDSAALSIRNLANGETITLDGKNKLITSSKSHPDLPSHFNFHFPRICNTLTERKNEFTLSKDSVSCSISFTYSPIIKTGL